MFFTVIFSCVVMTGDCDCDFDRSDDKFAIRNSNAVVINISVSGYGNIELFCIQIHIVYANILTGGSCCSRI